MITYQSTIKALSSILVGVIQQSEKYWNNRVIVAVPLTIVMLGVIPCVLAAQTGTIIGDVRDAFTGEPLAGASVSVQATGQNTTSDIDGRFMLRRTPTGNQTLVIGHLGYITREITLEIVTGQHIQHHVDLVGEQVDGDRILSIARKRAESRALNSQKESANFTSVMSYDQFNRFAAYTVEEAMVRVPGVQVSSRGEINLRGVGHNRYNVSLDGQRMATTGFGDRSVDLGSISSDMVYDLEVIKVLTPDMDADGMAGTINIHTLRPAGENRYLNGRIGGQGDPRFFRHTGPGSRALLQYAERLRDDISISAFISYQGDNRGWESLEVAYDVAEFGSGPVDVIERVSPGFHTDQHNRLGGGLGLIFQPTAQRTYYLNALLNRNNVQAIRHRNTMAAGGDWLSPDSTGRQGGRGNFMYDMGMQDIHYQQYMIQAGARHLENFFNLEYSVGWSHSQNRQNGFLFPFGIRDGLNYAIDMQNRTRPAMQITNIRLLEDGSVDQRLMFFDNLDFRKDNHIDNTFSGRFDLTYPHRLGTLQMGSSALIIYKEGNFFESNYTHSRLTMFRFDQTEGLKVYGQQEYNMPWLLNANNAQLFFETSRALFQRNDELYYRSDIWNYNANEQRYASYGMATLDLGIMRIIGGARMEHSVNKYDGKIVEFNDEGSYAQTNENSKKNNNTHLFPHAQLIITPGTGTQVRLAYSKSMTRPDFNILAPFELTNIQTLSLFRGNSDLNPVISNNLDVMLEQYFPGNGRFGMGLFYKELSGLIYERERTVEIMSGDIMAFDGLFDEQTTVVAINERSFENSDQKTDVYGLELFWQQNLAFLPGFLSNFGIYSNYTRSHSVYRVDYRDDNVRLPYQSPHVVNAAVNYSQGRVFLQTTYHWTAKFVSHLQESPELAPSVHQGNEVYMDIYQDGWKDLSVSGSFRISNNFRFWVNVNNLLGTDRYQYVNDRELFPLRSDFRGTYRINMGLMYNISY